MRQDSTPWVIAHGFTQHGAMMRELIDLVGIEAVAPDLPGHATGPPQCDAHTAVRVLTDALDLARPPATLVGYSQGGRMALLAAISQPHSVRQLILISASAGLRTQGERARRQASDELLAQTIERDVAAFLADWSTQFPGMSSRGADWVAQDLAERSTSSGAGLSSALRGYGQGAQPSAWERLSELTMPVTLIVGSNDAKYRAIAEEMATEIAHVDIVTLKGGHALVGENPWDLAGVIRNRLTEGSSSGHRQANE